MRNLLLSIIYIIGFSSVAQSDNAIYTVLLIKAKRLENGQIERTQVLIDSLGSIKGDKNVHIDHLNIQDFNKEINKFMASVNFEKHDASDSKNPVVNTPYSIGEYINIYVTKLSDFRKESNLGNKTSYFYSKFYPFQDDSQIVKYDFETFVDEKNLTIIYKYIH